MLESILKQKTSYLHVALNVDHPVSKKDIRETFRFWDVVEVVLEKGVLVFEHLQDKTSDKAEQNKSIQDT